MNRSIKSIGIIICIMAAFSMPALAMSGDEEVFGPAFCETLNPEPGNPFGLRELAYLDDVFYGYLGESIYTWQPGDAQPAQYCSMPSIPAWKEEWRSKSFNDLSTDDQTALTGAVDYIAAGDGALWGYNTLSGRIGKITEQGVTWASQPMDTSCLFQEGSIMLGVVPIQSFVEDGKLYIFGDNVKHIKPVNEPMVLLRFDMSSGEYDVLETKATINCCRYKPGSFLLLRRGDSSSMILSTMDIASGTIDDLPLKVPFPDRTYEGLESVGGLAYDLKNDQIFFSMKSQVWSSQGGKPFESVAKLPMETYYRMPAWVLPDGRYALFAVNLFVRQVN